MRIPRYVDSFSGLEATLRGADQNLPPATTFQSAVQDVVCPLVPRELGGCFLPNFHYFYSLRLILLA